MAEIVLEGAAFVVLVAAVAGLLLFVAVTFTPLGVRLRQSRNRRLIEGAAERTCPIHGPHAPEDMVRLPNGERICPECFKEVVHG
jgi:hypothetical protein